MKKIVLLIFIAIGVSIISLLLFAPKGRTTFVKTNENFRALNFQIKNELSSALKIKNLNNENFKISDFYMIIDEDGFVNYISAKAVLKSGESNFLYAIQYTSTERDGTFKIDRERSTADDFVGLGIDLFSDYYNILPKENSSSIRSMGYFRSISISSSSESFHVTKNNIKKLESNASANKFQDVFVVCIMHTKTNDMPTYYYLSNQ